MSLRVIFLSSMILWCGAIALQGAAVSRQQAEVFERKLATIAEHGNTADRARGRRTAVTETEVNSWFTYRADPLLPEGVAQPKLTLIGNGRVMGVVTVDLDAIGKRRASGSVLDPWSYLGGRVPVTVTGVVHTKDGQGRFELQQADASGIPVPRTLIQEIVSYYSRTPDHPQGVRLDDPFALPANIRQIDIGPGQAVVVQ